MERSIFERLVYIGAISKSESSNVHLVAVTSAGKVGHISVVMITVMIDFVRSLVTKTLSILVLLNSLFVDIIGNFDYFWSVDVL